MAEKLEYKSWKWDKAVQNDIKRVKELKGLDPTMNNMKFVIRSEQNKPKEERDYVSLYTSLQLEYHMLAERSYLRDNQDSSVISYTYASGIAAILAYVFDIQNPVLDRYQTEQEDLMYDYNYGVYQLFAVSGSLPECLRSLDDPLIQLIFGDFDKAISLIPTTSDTYDPKKPYTLLFGKTECELIHAIVNADQKRLKELLIGYVKFYRKKQLYYSKFIDPLSTTFIKLARQYGMECDLDIIEIPKMFFDNEKCSQCIEQVEIPFLEDAIEQLDKYGVKWY